MGHDNPSRLRSKKKIKIKGDEASVDFHFDIPDDHEYLYIHLDSEFFNILGEQESKGIAYNDYNTTITCTKNLSEFDLLVTMKLDSGKKSFAGDTLKIKELVRGYNIAEIEIEKDD
ncbi:MAG: hypothetical protein U5J64_10375 [Halobacteriales archaeon]|nr:hypothetical protein [Halobacteriales archaeon]